MEKEFGLRKKFIKDRNNLDMLRRSLESKGLDADIIPILEKFFLLPMTPIESCYGHPENGKNPYLSYVEDIPAEDLDNEIQKSFREKLDGLQSRINLRLREDIVSISIDKTKHGGGPDDFTIRFVINNKSKFIERGEDGPTDYDFSRNSVRI